MNADPHPQPELLGADPGDCFPAAWGQAVVDALPQPVLVADPQGCVRAWNRACAEALGGRAQEANFPLARLLADAGERARVAGLTRRVLAGETLEAVPLRLRAGGPELTRLARLAPLRGEGGQVQGCVLTLTAGAQAASPGLGLSPEVALGAVPAPLVVLDPQHRYLYCNPAAIRDEGIRAWIIGRDDFEYCAYRGFDPAVAARRRAHFQEAVRRRGEVSWEEQFTLPDGTVRHERRFLSPVFGPGGELARVIGYGLDVSEHRQAQEALGRLNGELEARVRARTAELEAATRLLQHAALHDTLTGLPNRTLFGNRLEGALARGAHGAARPAAAAAAVLLLDTDRFKAVNDSHGHPAGDALLVALAGRLRAEVRPEDTLARLGGDEFAVLLESPEGPGEAAELAGRLQAALARPFTVQGREHAVTASIGIVVTMPGEGETAASVLRDAEIAMYRAKALGRAGHQVFTPEMRERALGLIRLEHDLRGAAARGELRVVYQPIVAVQGGQTVGFEALVRWQHPQLGPLSPADFIEVAEETGLILDLDRWVLREACAQVRAWQREWPGPRPLSLSVNFSGRHFASQGALAGLRRILHETDFDPRALRLEITEGVFLHGQATRETLASIRDLGVALHIDDFGTGYSSLSYLQAYPVDALKVDRSFIRGMLLTPEGAELVRTIVEMAKNLGLRVVAEGIEDPAQLDRLRLLGCEYAQGYLLSRPLEAGDVPAFLSGNKEADRFETP